MTLEEAIRLFEQREKSDDPKRFGVPKTMAEYGAYCRQLAKWLKELKTVHDEIDDADDEDEIFIGYLRQKMRGD